MFEEITRGEEKA